MVVVGVAEMWLVMMWIYVVEWVFGRVVVRRMRGVVGVVVMLWVMVM